MATELHGARHDDGTGVKVKFIETQFVSSDAASFKATVQRLTGRYALMPPPATEHSPRPCRPYRLAFGTGEQSRPLCVSTDNQVLVAPKQAAGLETPRLEELHDLYDFGDLLYASSSAQRNGGGTINGSLTDVL